MSGGEREDGGWGLGLLMFDFQKDKSLASQGPLMLLVMIRRTTNCSTPATTANRISSDFNDGYQHNFLWSYRNYVVRESE